MFGLEYVVVRDACVGVFERRCRLVEFVYLEVREVRFENLNGVNDLFRFVFFM